MKNIIIIFILITSLMGCYNRQMTIQKSKDAYLNIVGEKEGITVFLDDQKLDISDNFYIKDTLLQIKPGIYIVKIYRFSNLIVERKIIFDSGVTTEIEI